MTDITKCIGGPCERKMQCFRYCALPSGFQQSYMEPPDINGPNNGCEYFIPNPPDASP